MPPSTVFSYWRRDHRRSSASPAPPQQQQQQQSQQPQQQQPTSSAPKGSVAENPPRLPLIPNTPDLSTRIGEPSAVSESGSGSNTNQRASEENPSPSQGEQNQNQTDRLNAVAPSSSSRAPSSSATNLTVPSSSLEKQVRPHSSPEERERASVLTSQSNGSQSSFPAPRPDVGEGDSSSSRQNSPFRLSFGKGISNSNSNTPPSDSRKHAPTTVPGTAQSAPSKPNNNHNSNNNNNKSSPDDSPADKPGTSQKESKLERSNSRRNVDREGSSDHAHHKSGKAMLNLLNPMSLLARRRSSRLAGSRADDLKIGAPNLVPAIPDDYDPRIRGHIVHDFSAPRPRRNLATTPVPQQDGASQQGTNESPQAASATDPSSQTGEQKAKHAEHSPAFKEHFEDDQRALQVENKGYLQSSLLTSPSHEGEHSLPAFARNLPSKIPEHEERPSEEEQKQPQPQQQQQQPQEKEQEQTVVDPKPQPEPLKKDLPTVREEEDTVVDMSPQQPSGLPRHFKSNASRFSFDMSGMESSVQEKLLEEKHKEKEAERKAKYGSDDGEYSDDDDYSGLLDDMDDSLEEKIPGVNVDADEDELDGFSGSGNMMSRSWFSPGLSPIIGSPASPVGPNLATLPIAQGAPVPPGLIQNPLRSNPVSGNNENTQPQETSAEQSSTEKAPMIVGANPGKPQPTNDDDDDLYFDDGEFGDLSADVGDGEKFDESIFDDETSHLYDRKKKAAEPPAPADNERQEATRSSDSSSDEEQTARHLESHTEGLKHAPSMASEYRGPPPRAYGSISERAPDPGSAKAHSGVLSEHNLEALHNALTKAAAGNERFEPTDSISERSLDRVSAAQTAQTADSHPGLISDNSRLSQAMEAFGSEEVFEDFDYDDSDAALYDDPIIAAANAEALENDDEGFYGQEFGFYAQAHGNGSQLTNGGYFGPRGVEGISRSFSSRGKFREPSLTPITERSERSTRNSVISLTAHGAGANANPAMSSPGLAQLVDMGNLDDEMSLSALMKLRRGAWGGSNGSLRSSSASPPPAASHPHSSSNRGSFTALSDASPTVQALPADLIWPGSGSATESPVREAERNGSSSATSPV